ncbi:MAG: hypothetical protein ACT4QE_01780 [Anaerolineales bacterium]
MKVNRAGCVMGVLLSAALTCGSGATVLALSQRWLPAARLPSGYTALVCAGAQFAPPQFEATVILPQLRSVSAMFHLPGRCAWLPWLPALPYNVHFRFP